MPVASATDEPPYFWTTIPTTDESTGRSPADRLGARWRTPESGRTSAMTDARPAEQAGKDRRRFLSTVAGVAGLAAASQFPVGRAVATVRPEGGDYPFQLGVASGDPTPHGVGAVDPAGAAPVPARRRHAPTGGCRCSGRSRVDERFTLPVVSGTVWALPQLAHSVHVDVRGPAARPGVVLPLPLPRRHLRRGPHPDGAAGRCADQPARPGLRLLPGLGQWLLPVLPAPRRRRPRPGAAPRRLHLRGRHPRRRRLLRKVRTPRVLREAPRNLDRWRMQYALFKSDPELQAAHAPLPVGGDVGRPRGAERLRQHQSQYEGDITRAPCRGLPGLVRAPAGADAGPAGQRRAADLPPPGWGDLAQIDIVDGRQYRTIPACGWGEADACEAAYDPSATMLGKRQERWLYRRPGGERTAMERARRAT